MNIIITIAVNEQKFDYEVNSLLSINEALDIITKNTEIVVNDVDYIFSTREKKDVSVYQTFREANIYTGDIIVVKGDN
jgi:hypothetical protein